MGREFARFSVKLSETFDLGEGLDAESPGVTSANFYGPNSSHTDIPNSLESLNALASNNTKYTIIDIKDQTGGTGGTGGTDDSGDSVDFHSGTFHGEDAIAADHEIIIPVDSSGKCGGVLELSDFSSTSGQDEGGMLSWNFDASTMEIKMQQCWSGGSGIYNKSASINATLTSTYQTINISTSYQLAAWEAKYLNGNLYLTSDSHYGVWQATTTTPGTGGTGGGSAITFIDKISVGTLIYGAWTTVSANSAWSGANSLIVHADSFDVDTGGNSSIELKARASSSQPTEVLIIDHNATSGGRQITQEQAFIPVADDGSFEYYITRNSSNATIRNFNVAGFMSAASGSGGAAGGGGGIFSTGWSTSIPSADSNVTYTHNLGTDDILYKVYVRDSSGNEHDVTSAEVWSGVVKANSTCVNITTTQITIRFLSKYLDWTKAVTGVNPDGRDWSTATHIKVVVSASGSGGGV